MAHPLLLSITEAKDFYEKNNGNSIVLDSVRYGGDSSGCAKSI
jgi:hypothetical protein